MEIKFRFPHGRNHILGMRVQKLLWRPPCTIYHCCLESNKKDPQLFLLSFPLEIKTSSCKSLSHAFVQNICISELILSQNCCFMSPITTKHICYNTANRASHHIEPCRQNTDPPLQPHPGTGLTLGVCWFLTPAAFLTASLPELNTIDPSLTYTEEMIWGRRCTWIDSLSHTFPYKDVKKNVLEKLERVEHFCVPI